LPSKRRKIHDGKETTIVRRGFSKAAWREGGRRFIAGGKRKALKGQGKTPKNLMKGEKVSKAREREEQVQGEGGRSPFVFPKKRKNLLHLRRLGKRRGEKIGGKEGGGPHFPSTS